MINYEIYQQYKCLILIQNDHSNRFKLLLSEHVQFNQTTKLSLINV